MTQTAKKKATPRQRVTLDELPREVRQAVMNARGRPVVVTLPAPRKRFYG